jgi:hypothetical protein
MLPSLATALIIWQVSNAAVAVSVITAYCRGCHATRLAFTLTGELQVIDIVLRSRLDSARVFRRRKAP